MYHSKVLKFKWIDKMYNYVSITYVSKFKWHDKNGKLNLNLINQTTHMQRTGKTNCFKDQK